MLNWRLITSALIILSSALLSGCSHNFGPRPGVDAVAFEQIKARCSYVARHGGNGFSVEGNVKFVAAAALGNIIGEAVRTGADYNDCMLASGLAMEAPRGESRSMEISYRGDDRGMEDEYQTAQPWTAKRQLIHTVSKRKACVNAIRTSGRYDLVLPRLGNLSNPPYTMAQFANETMPSVKESALVANYVDEVDRCIATWVAVTTPIHPMIAKTYQDAWTRSQEVTVLLVRRQITWGECAERQREITQDLVTTLNQVSL